MEGGNRVRIPLDSGLDVHSSDMMAPAADPKFEHNRQLFQGRYLPSSLRFERNGWAAGSDVYTFDISNTSVETTGGTETYTVTRTSNFNSNPAYMLEVTDGDGVKIGSCVLNEESRELSHETDTLTVGADGADTVLKGTVNGRCFCLTYRGVSGGLDEHRYDTLPSDIGDSYTDPLLRVSLSVSSALRAVISVTDDGNLLSARLAGFRFPSGTLVNMYGGHRLLTASFSGHADGETVYTGSGLLSVYIGEPSGGTCSVRVERGGEAVAVGDAEVTALTDGDTYTGEVDLSFTVDMTMRDTPKVSTQNFTPYFFNVGDGTDSRLKSVKTGAPTGVAFNRWYSYVTDTGNPDWPDFLFRNLPGGKDSEGTEHTAHCSGTEDTDKDNSSIPGHNCQTVTQFFSAWFGVRAEYTDSPYSGAWTYDRLIAAGYKKRPLEDYASAHYKATSVLDYYYVPVTTDSTSGASLIQTGTADMTVTCTPTFGLRLASNTTEYYNSIDGEWLDSSGNVVSFYSKKAPDKVRIYMFGTDVTDEFLCDNSINAYASYIYYNIEVTAYIFINMSSTHNATGYGYVADTAYCADLKDLLIKYAGTPDIVIVNIGADYSITSNHVEENISYVTLSLSNVYHLYQAYDGKAAQSYVLRMTPDTAGLAYRVLGTNTIGLSYDTSAKSLIISPPGMLPSSLTAMPDTGHFYWKLDSSKGVRYNSDKDGGFNPEGVTQTGSPESGKTTATVSMWVDRSKETAGAQGYVQRDVKVTYPWTTAGTAFWGRPFLCCVRYRVSIKSEDALTESLSAEDFLVEDVPFSVGDLKDGLLYKCPSGEAAGRYALPLSAVMNGSNTVYEAVYTAAGAPRTASLETGAGDYGAPRLSVTVSPRAVSGSGALMCCSDDVPFDVSGDSLKPENYTHCYFMPAHIIWGNTGGAVYPAVTAGDSTAAGSICGETADYDDSAGWVLDLSGNSDAYVTGSEALPLTGGMSSYTVPGREITSEVYSDIMSDYGLSLSLTGTGAAVPSRTGTGAVESCQMYSYISGIEAAPADTGGLVPGCRFTDELSGDFMSSLYFTCGAWQGYFKWPGAGYRDGFDCFESGGQSIEYGLDVTSEDENGVAAKTYRGVSGKYALDGSAPVMGGGYLPAGDIDGQGVPEYAVGVDLEVTDASDTSDIENLQPEVSRWYLTLSVTDGYRFEGLQLPYIVADDDSDDTASDMTCRDWRLVSYTGQYDKGVLTAESAGRDPALLLTVDYSAGECMLREAYDWGEYGPQLECDETWLDGNGVELTAEDIRKISVILRGVYKVSGVTVTGMEVPSGGIAGANDNEAVLVFTADGVSYNTADLKALLYPGEEGSITFRYTRPDDEELKSRAFASFSTADEYQFLRQQWDTDNSTENFWWVDSCHVMALTPSEFILRTKASETDGWEGETVTDWDGDVFADTGVWDRTSVIDGSVQKYLMSSAYGTGARALFITAGVDGSAPDCVLLRVYDPLTMARGADIRLYVTHKDIGSALLPDGVTAGSLYTYSDIHVDSMLPKCRLSATAADGFLILGIKYDNNFNQWAVVVGLTETAGVLSVSGVRRIVQGYGCVGLDGCLTGGEIPSSCFDASRGFTGTVTPLSDLSGDAEELSDWSAVKMGSDMRIVGDESRQWYVTKCVPSIISHLKWDGSGGFTAEELPLNSNYSAGYWSPSFRSNVVSGMKLNACSFTDLLGIDVGGTWNKVLSALGAPVIYYFAPRLTTGNYLQQTLGQAAYVHYNSTSAGAEKDVTEESVTRNYSVEEADDALQGARRTAQITSDEVSFDLQTIKQEQKISDPYTVPFMLLASAAVSALDLGQDMLQVNHAEAQTSVADVGRKYAQFAMQNMNSMTVSDMQMRSIQSVQTSEVTAVKTLDMFYSTSDRQEVRSGPGFVQHRFEAQCAAQSVTSVQSEFLQQSFTYIVGTLTLYTAKLQNWVLHQALALTELQTGAYSGSDINGGGFVVLTSALSLAVKIACLAAWVPLKIACKVSDIEVELIPQLLSSIGADSMKTAVTAQQSKHKYDVESKHRYGSRSECFMWPCFGVPDGGQEITDESVEVTYEDKAWELDLGVKNRFDSACSSGQPSNSNVTDVSKAEAFSGEVPYCIAMIKGVSAKERLPEDMAYVIGAEKILSDTPFKNENIGEDWPVFPSAPIQDYIIEKDSWELGMTVVGDTVAWVSCRDTKLIEGEPSNIVIDGSDFCGVACPYAAVEVRQYVSRKYLRPVAVTPQVLALNNSGLNCCYEEKAYHAFDGYGYRVVSWTGSAGMGKNWRTWLYSSLLNDRLKRSNMLPPNTYPGNFLSDPETAVRGDSNDRLKVTVEAQGKGDMLIAGTPGEDRSVRRYAVPVLTESVGVLPAAVKTLAALTLSVFDGVTGLTVNNHDLQTAYKAPLSVDFTIGKSTYRYTQEYICELNPDRKIATIARDVVPCLGLTFLGATPYEAYLYSAATRRYYVYTGGTSLQAADMVERFRNVLGGHYDFVNQEVLLPAEATFLRLDERVLDDGDETDNTMVLRLKDRRFAGEVAPPPETVYNTRSGFRVVSLPTGVVFQGPNRCVINRFVYSPHMRGQIRANLGRWGRVPREEYHPFRTYAGRYERQEDELTGDGYVDGWTHNPFLLVTAPIGIDEDTDCMFEWELTFAWPVEMDELYGPDNYACVNVQAETMTPGGRVTAARPAHIYLTKELFTRTGSYGYYSFRYQGLCGAGNRERLHIWSDQYICLSGLQLEYKVVTQRRTEILTQQVDVSQLEEL